jgi:mono/diheme cytochrome c family protein
MLRVFAGFLVVVFIVVGAWVLLTRDETPIAAPVSPDVSAPASPAAQGKASEAPAAPAPENEGAAAEGAAPAAEGGSPAETAKTAEKGSLKSPYADYASVAEEGHKIYMAAGCNGCHGGGGGGGMGPPLTNPVWVYGKDDDTLFRLIALGSDELQKQGYSRKGSENVVGPMPQMGTVVKSDDDMWKLIAWIRSVNPSSAGNSSASVSEPAATPQ